MTQLSLACRAACTAVTLSSLATAQYVVTTDDASDRLIAFSPVDGSLVSDNMFSIPNSVQVGAIDVNGEIWVTEQTGDRVVRYDTMGNVLGSMGPTLPGGGMDNIRGLNFINGIVYVTNDGTGNGATADSLVTFDPAGNYLGTIPLAFSPSPFTVLPFGGDLLVVSSSATDDLHRYSTSGVSLGTFHNSAAIGFGHAACIASDGNVWVSTFTSDTILKLDASNGANILQTVPTDNARGVFELQNGNLLWTNTSGTWVHDFGTATNTLVRAGSNYNLFPVLPNANHIKYGTGCHVGTIDKSNLFQLFADVGQAKAALDGNALHFAFTGTGYTATWLAGVASGIYVPPSPAAPIIANADSITTTITPSVAIPVPGGTTATWTVSSNGVVTAGSAGNQTTTSPGTLTSTSTATGLAFYTWANHNPAEASSGKVKWEELGGVLFITFEGVEFSGGTPTLAPSTFQWQINETTGDVVMLWTTFSSSNSTSDVIVGCTLAGAGVVPVSQTLATATPLTLSPDVVLSPMTLSAAPAPVISPGTNVTYTIGGVPELFPGAGLYFSTLILTVNPFPTGLDLVGILTTVPGCKLYLSALDVNIGGAITATPFNTVPLTFSTPTFAPGNVIGAQGVGLYDGSFALPNGESSGFLLSNAVRSITQTQ